MEFFFLYDIHTSVRENNKKDRKKKNRRKITITRTVANNSSFEHENMKKIEPNGNILMNNERAERGIELELRLGRYLNGERS